jgi:hypothetical protein
MVMTSCEHVGIGNVMPEVECLFCEIERLRKQRQYRYRPCAYCGYTHVFFKWKDDLKVCPKCSRDLQGGVTLSWPVGPDEFHTENKSWPPTEFAGESMSIIMTSEERAMALFRAFASGDAEWSQIAEEQRTRWRFVSSTVESWLITATDAGKNLIGPGELAHLKREESRLKEALAAPIPMQLWCPLCHTRHIDEGEFAAKPHTTHACQNPTCGLVWKPAKVPTIGVWDLPGYLNSKEVSKP